MEFSSGQGPRGGILDRGLVGGEVDWVPRRLPKPLLCFWHRRVREAQEEGSGSLDSGRQKAVQVQQGLHRGLGGVPGQASSQARGSEPSQHAHGGPKAQPLPL